MISIPNLISQVILQNCYLQMQQETETFHLIYTLPQWNFVKPILKQIMNREHQRESLVKQLHSFHLFSYTTMNKTSKREVNTSLSLLSKWEKQQIVQVFGLAAGFVLEHEQNPPRLPLFKTGTPFEHTYSKQDILLLVCCMCLLLIPHQEKCKYRFGMIRDFSYIFSEQPYKTKCIFEYLKMELNRWKDNQELAQEKMTIHRHLIKKSLEELLEEKKDKVMSSVHICHDKESIEDFYGENKADFANKHIGGGSLGAGCVQEEIMFANRPELYTTMLLCEVMKENEAIVLSGFKKYFCNSGYAGTCAYDGPDHHEYSFDQHNRANQFIVVIDALHFPRKNDPVQYQMQHVNREILKAFAGFQGGPGNKIVTGNWGCGAFNGDVQLKFLIQWIAASMASKQYIYVPFGWKDKLSQEKFLNRIKEKTVYEAYMWLLKGCEQIKNGKDSIFLKMIQAT